MALVISSLATGGAERVLSLMANHWARSGRRVTVITMSDTRSDHFLLDPSITRIALDVIGASRSKWLAVASNARRVAALRRAIKAARAPVVISFGETTNVVAVIAAVGTGSRVVVAEVTDPRRHVVGWIWGLLRRVTYPRADRVVVQSAETRPWASKMVGLERSRVIANPVPTPRLPAASSDASRPLTLLGVGRLVEVKGFDDLIRAFAAVTRRFPEWRLLILGDGDQREALIALSESLGVADRVQIPGSVPDPAPIMAQSEIFVLSSRYEGFPNALLEAMSVGMAVISTDCPTGPREIVESGVNGILVPPGDGARLAEAIAGLMGDEHARRTLGARAKGVRQRFSIEKVMAQWDSLIMELVGENATATTRR